ncbi:MAG TPA: hypothetical protein VF746_30770 [Longimicrobium sp.]|jgi:hypothetical protein
MPGRNRSSNNNNNQQKTYEELKQDEKCIYQAFKAATGVGQHALWLQAQQKGSFEPDDGDVIAVLAAIHGFEDEVSAFSGSDFVGDVNGVQSNLTGKPGTDFIMVVADRSKVKHSAKVYTATDPRSVLKESNTLFKDVPWHAIYGKVQPNRTIAWTDKQQRLPTGPTANDVVICFVRRPKKK